METDRIEGMVTLLCRIEHGDVAKHFDALKQSGLLDSIDVKKDPSVDKLKDLLKRNRLWLWQVRSPFDATHLGWTGLVRYAGPAYVFANFGPQAHFDTFDIPRECIEAVSKAYFANCPEEDRLFLYVASDLLDKISASVMELGFDPAPDIKYDDTPNESIFIMERHTFDAYYAEGEGTAEEFEEIDDY